MPSVVIIRSSVLVKLDCSVCLSLNGHVKRQNYLKGALDRLLEAWECFELGNETARMGDGSLLCDRDDRKIRLTTDPARKLGLSRKRSEEVVGVCQRHKLCIIEGSRDALALVV